MKLHLPLGLLSALLLSFSALQQRAEAVQVLTRTFFSANDWEQSPNHDNVWNLDLAAKGASLTTDHWSITLGFYVTAGFDTRLTAGFDAASIGYPAELNPSSDTRAFYLGMWRRHYESFSQGQLGGLQGGSGNGWTQFVGRIIINISAADNTLRYTVNNNNTPFHTDHNFAYADNNNARLGPGPHVIDCLSFRGLREDYLSAVIIDSVREMENSRVYTWVGASGANTMGRLDTGDIYGGYSAVGDSDENAVMVGDAWGYYEAVFGSGVASTGVHNNGEFSKLRFLAEGSYYTGARETETNEQITEVEVGEGQAVFSGSNPFWNYVQLGGIIVAEGATGYSFSDGHYESGSAAGAVTLYLGSSNNNGVSTTINNLTYASDKVISFTIHEDFSLGLAGKKWTDIRLVEGVEVMTVDVDKGKTFTIYGESKHTDRDGDLLLAVSGGGTLAVREADSFNLSETTSFYISDGSILDLGNASVTESSIVTIKNGSLRNMQNFGGSVYINAEDGAGAMSMGGVTADQIKTIRTSNNGARLTDIGAGTLTLHNGDALWIGEENLSTRTGSAFYLLDFVGNGANGILTFDDPNAQVSLNLSNELQYTLDEGNLNNRMYLWLSDGTFDLASEGVDPTDYHDLQKWFNRHFTLTAGSTIEVVEGKGADAGKMLLIISTDHVWYTDRHGEEVNLVDRLNDENHWHKVVVSSKLDMDLTPEDATHNRVILRYLSSIGDTKSDGGTLTITRNDMADGTTNDLIIELRNTTTPDWQGGPNKINADSVFDRDIIINDKAGRTILRKTGDGKLTLNGNVSSEGLLSFDEKGGGTLVINGDDSTVGMLSQINGTLEINGKLTVLYASDLRNSDSPLSSSGSIIGSGLLEMKGDFYAGQRFTSENSVTLQVDKGATLYMATDAASYMGGIAGDGTIHLGSDLNIKGKYSVFTGTLDSTASAGTINIIDAGTHQVLQTAGIFDWSLDVQNGAALTLIGTEKTTGRSSSTTYNNITISGAREYDRTNASTLIISAQGDGEQYSAATTVIANEVTFGQDSTVYLLYNFHGVDNEDLNNVGPMLQANKLDIGRDTLFVLGNVGSAFALAGGVDIENLVVMTATNSLTGYYADGDELNWDTSGIFMIYYRDISLTRQGKDVVLNARVQNENIFTPVAENSAAVAGGQLLWEARYSSIMADLSSSIYSVMDYVAFQAIKGDTKEASRVLTAVAGSTVPTLGTAQRDAMRSQLVRMRDHTGVMGLNPDYTYEELPYWHCWLEGTGNSTELSNDDMLSGYKLTSWGGSFGADVDVDSTTNVGFSISALYGNLSAGEADHLSGNMDNIYLNFLGHFAKNRWTHTTIVSFGLNNTKYDRTVSYGPNSYTTHGDTSGWGVGLMYELTYDYILNEEGSEVLQPLVNVSLTKTSLRAFEESGDKAMALNVDKQEWTTGTVALGARYLSEIGSAVFDRSAQLELRANIAQDLGDTRGQANVALLANPGTKVAVNAAEAGKTALQLGMGLRVPVNENTLLYANGSADIRSSMTTWNMAIGVRYDF